MTIQIGECILGIFALSEDLEILDSEMFKPDVREISEKLRLIRKGKLAHEHLELIKKLIKNGHTEFEIESDELASKLNEEFENTTFRSKIPSPANLKLRSSIHEIAKEQGIENLNEIFRDVNILIIRKDLREKASEKDKIVIETINTMDELDKTINALYERIREWYGIHFPELERHVSDYTEYFVLISKFGGRENFAKEKITATGISEEKAVEIENASNNSVGSDFDEIDIEAIKTCVNKVQRLQEARDKTSDYLEDLMEQVAPNIKTLVGGPIGARLISQAGGLEKLAKMPSSTIQVLGAEKALFRSLKEKGAKPPKHGIIFQYPEIRGSPKDIRGKIARALAGKLAIVARVDAMSGRYIGDQIREELEEKIERIKSGR